MNELLAKIIDAHGGMDRWNGYEKVDATIVSGGGLFPLKGVPQDPSPRRMTAWLHEERSSVSPYGAPDQSFGLASSDLVTALRNFVFASSGTQFGTRARMRIRLIAEQPE